eukprot:248916-Prorocentrum_minimum.AAC.1
MPPTASQKAVRKAMAAVRAFACSPAPAKSLPSTAEMASLKPRKHTTAVPRNGRCICEPENPSQRRCNG